MCSELTSEKGTDTADREARIPGKLEHVANTDLSSERGGSNCNPAVHECTYWNADGLKNQIDAYILMPSQVEEA
jgi:hypothetical protein